MAFRHRKLFETFINITTEIVCVCKPTPDHCCPAPCLPLCPSTCLFPLLPPPDPPFPPDSGYHPIKSNKPSTQLIVTLVSLASVFLLACCCALYLKFYAGRNRSRRSSQRQSEDTHDEFLDEDHGPVVDHPIWYINTVGLQPSIISAITVCKYKRADGLVEGTECAVCLNEFQEDETLRLLPKCSHAFHIPCIDTWLRSHTNCPMCRAGIVVSAAGGAPSPEPAVENSGQGGETQVGSLENYGEFGRELTGDGVCELGDGTEEGELGFENLTNSCENSTEQEGNDNRQEAVDEVQPRRRSVSMDFPSASVIGLALANAVSGESAGNSDTQSAKFDKSNMGIVPKRAGGNQSLLRFMASSSGGRSLQLGPVSMKRSFSCGAKFLLSRYGRSQNPVLPS